MSILISTFSAEPHGFTDDQNAKLDEASFFLSEGNWREHLDELFLKSVEIVQPVDEIERAARSFIDYHEGKTGLSDHTRWHIDIATKVLGLAQLAGTCGADQLGASG